MALGTDSDYLRHGQYRDAGNLDARISLHDAYSTSPQPYHEWLFGFLDLPPAARILEVGCGTGVFWTRNAARVSPDWQLTLTDLSAGMVERAREAFAEAGLTAEFAELDVEQAPYPWPNESFDAVVAHNMLYHVNDRRTALSELQRVLTSGGRLYAATNGSAHLREIRDLERRFNLPSVFGATASAQNFGLQNGAVQLEPYFREIVCHRHDNALLVPDAALVVDHVRSKLPEPDAVTEQLIALHMYLQHQIALDGPLRITKASGLFVATRKD